jgi:hypothetical protein
MASVPDPMMLVGEVSNVSVKSVTSAAFAASEIKLPSSPVTSNATNLDLITI